MKIDIFNNWLANKLSDYLATMVCFYIVLALVLSILFLQLPRTPLEWIGFVIQTLFQGVALPVLAFVAKISGEKQERLLTETHDAVIEELTYIKEVLKSITLENKELQEIQDTLDEIENG